ncbi:hypothetical protein, partial [Streptococcus pneumoniae]
FLSSKKHPLGEKRNHPGSKLRQGFWMVFRLGVHNWGKYLPSTEYLRYTSINYLFLAFKLSRRGYEI